MFHGASLYSTVWNIGTIHTWWNKYHHHENGFVRHGKYVTQIDPSLLGWMLDDQLDSEEISHPLWSVFDMKPHVAVSLTIHQECKHTMLDGGIYGLLTTQCV